MTIGEFWPRYPLILLIYWVRVPNSFGLLKLFHITALAGSFSKTSLRWPGLIWNFWGNGLPSIWDTLGVKKALVFNFPGFLCEKISGAPFILNCAREGHLKGGGLQKPSEVPWRNNTRAENIGGEILGAQKRNARFTPCS